jgi:hypothetical protein
MIAKEFEEMTSAERNQIIQKQGLSKGGEQTTRQYCMKLVAPEIRKDFINQLNTLEKAAAGKLKDPVKEDKSESGTKLNKDIILKIIDEELLELEEESRRERQTRVFGEPWNQMMQISKGIYEEDSDSKKKKKKEPKYKGCKGNPRHRSRDTAAGKAGTFMSDKDIESGKKGSASFWYSCRDKLGRVGLKGKKHRWIKDPAGCGRSSTDSPRRKCSDFKEEQSKELIPESLKRRWGELIEVSPTQTRS